MLYSVKVPDNVLLLQTSNKHSQAVHWMDNQTDLPRVTLGCVFVGDSMSCWCFHSFAEYLETSSSLCHRWAGICFVCNMTFRRESHTYVKKQLNTEQMKQWIGENHTVVSFIFLTLLRWLIVNQNDEIGAAYFKHKKMREAYSTFFEKSEGKKPLGKT